MTRVVSKDVSLGQRIRASAIAQKLVDDQDFVVASTVVVDIDLNKAGKFWARAEAEEWCRNKLQGKWRRRVIYRVGDAKVDHLQFEFENKFDALAFSVYRNSVGL